MLSRETIIFKLKDCQRQIAANTMSPSEKKWLQGEEYAYLSILRLSRGDKERLGIV